MRCQHCGAELKDVDALQTHQVTACPAIASDDDSILVPPDEPEQVEVEFKWLEDRIVSDQTKSVHLIISNLDNNIELQKSNGSFKAEGVQINTGVYNGQLVVGDEILTLAEFVVSQQSETIFLIIDRDSSQLTITEENTSGQPIESEDEQMGNSPRNTGFNIDRVLGSPQTDNSEMGNLLSEESFGMTASHRQQGAQSPPDLDGDEHYTFSPDDPTLKNLETLGLDLTPRSDHLPSENQQPFENEIHDNEPPAPVFSQLSGNSSARSDNDDDGGPDMLMQRGDGPNVEQMLHELSMTDHEGGDGGNDPFLEHRSLPRPPQAHHHENGFTSSMNEQKMPDTEPDILPSRMKTRTSDLSSRQKFSSPDEQRYLPGERSSSERSGRGRNSEEDYRRANRRSRSLSGSKKVDAETRIPRDERVDPEKEALKTELKRLQELTGNYKEVKAELEVKCQSYDEEIDRLKKKIKQLEETNKKDVENVKEIKSECDAKCQSYETEVNRLKEKCNEVIDTLQSRTEKENEVLNKLKEEYETKCQWYENEIVRLKEKCNELANALRNKDGKSQKDKLHQTPSVGEVEELQAKVHSYENELEKLTAKCSELEGLKTKTSIMSQKDERVKNIQRINELEAKCASYDEEMNRLKKHCFELEEQGRQNALVIAKSGGSNHDDEDEDLEHLVKMTELRAKCESYESELRRLQSACRELKSHVKKEQDLRKESEEEKKVLELRIDACNEELQKLGNKFKQQQLKSVPQHYTETLLSKHQEETMKNEQIIAELEAKCQSYDTEVQRLKRENEKFKEKYSKVKDYLRTFATQQTRMEVEHQAMKEENQRLKGENESLEMVRKLREKDVEEEKKTFQTSLDELRKENERLKERLRELSSTTTTTTTTKGSDSNKMHENILKLKKGNEKLRQKFNSLNNFSSLQKDYDSDEDEIYAPKIVSPPHQSTFSSSSSSGKYNAKAFINLPDKHKRASDEYDERNDRSYDNQRSSSYDHRSPSYDHRSYSSNKKDSVDYDLKRSEKHNHRYSQQTNGYSSRSNIDDVIKRYSNGSDLFSKETTTTPYHKRRSSLTDNVDSLGRYFGSGTMESRLPAKARSYEHGVNRIHRSQNDDDDDDEVSPITSPRSVKSPMHDSRTLIPFSPTHVNEVNVGMKVCVTRSNGRMSRGIVKWIGTLPNNYGDFIGVELETESGKHNGIFENVRYFRCKPNRGVFVKFSKVIMGWK